MTSYFRIFAVENLKTCWPARESPLTLTGGEVAKERCITKNQITMANRPLAYTLTERKATIGAMAEKIVLQARPTGCKRIDHRSFCDEVVHATTFTGVEVKAVPRLAAEIAKRHVENGDIVKFGDIGTLTPSFQSKSWRRARRSSFPTSTSPSLSCIFRLRASISRSRT